MVTGTAKAVTTIPKINFTTYLSVVNSTKNCNWVESCYFSKGTVAIAIVVAIDGYGGLSCCWRKLRRCDARGVRH